MKSNWFQSRFIGSTRLGDKIFCLKNRFSILKLLYTLWDEWILVKVCQIFILICLFILLIYLITSTYICLSVCSDCLCIPSVSHNLSVTFCQAVFIFIYLVLPFYRSLSIFHSSG